MSFPSGYSKNQIANPAGLKCTAISAKDKNVYFADIGTTTKIRKIDSQGTITDFVDPAFRVTSMYLFDTTLFIGGLTTDIPPIPTFKSVDINTGSITTYTLAGLTLDTGRGNFFAISTTTIYIADASAHFIDQISINTETNIATVSQYSITVPGNPSLFGIGGTGTTTSDFMYVTASDNNIYRVAISSSPQVPADVMTISGATLNSPLDIVYVNSDSALYIVDSGNNSIRRGTISGTTITITGSFTSGISSPQAINYSSSPGLLRFYVANNGASTGLSFPSTGGTTIDKLYQTSGGSTMGGDPHVKGLMNTDYYILPINNDVYNLFDNNDEFDHLVVNTQTQMYSFEKIAFAEEILKYFKEKNEVEYENAYNKIIPIYDNPEIYDVSFMKYVSFLYKDIYFVIDMDSLELINNTSLIFDKSNDFLQPITKTKDHNFTKIKEVSFRLVSFNTKNGCVNFKLYRLYDRLNFRNSIELNMEVSKNDKTTGLLINALDCKIVPSLDFVETELNCDKIKKIIPDTLNHYKNTIVPYANKKRQEVKDFINKKLLV